jgi:F-type H+-transporting ATPase subunit delta
MSSESGSGMTEPAPQHVVRTRPFDETLTAGARVYAEALINVASQQGAVDEVLGELNEFRDDILTRHPEFAAVMASKSLSVGQKDRILDDAFEGRAHPVLLRFLHVLNRHERLNIVGPILEEAQEIWDRRGNRRPVVVRSAVALDESQRQALRDRLVDMLNGATPVIRFEVDAALIGGLVVEIGDNLYNLSVRDKLQQVRSQLLEVKASEIRGQRESFVS